MKDLNAEHRKVTRPLRIILLLYIIIGLLSLEISAQFCYQVSTRSSQQLWLIPSATDSLQNAGDKKPGPEDTIPHRRDKCVSENNNAAE